MKFFILIFVLVFVLFIPFVSSADSPAEKVDYEYGYTAGITFGILIVPYIELFGEPTYRNFYPCPAGHPHYHVLFAWEIIDPTLPPYEFIMKVEFVFGWENYSEEEAPNIDLWNEQFDEEFIGNKTRL